MAILLASSGLFRGFGGFEAYRVRKEQDGDLGSIRGLGFRAMGYVRRVEGLEVWAV